MEEILAAVGSAIGMVGDVVTTLTGQPLFVFLIGVSLVPVGFKIFRIAKNTAKK